MSTASSALPTASPFDEGAYPWPYFAPDEIEAATKTLETGRVNQWTGEHVVAFGDEFAAYCDSRYGIALSNGTVALELALRCLDIGPGDEVLVTNRSFFASASAVSFMGATPIFCDVDPTTQNVTRETLAAKLTKRTRALICVHLAGWPCELDEIIDFAKSANLSVIEDCAQAHGARYRGRHVGSFGDIGTFSFCQDKIMSTGGEGGFMTTNSDELYERLWSLKDHGKDRQLAMGSADGPFKTKSFRWVHSSFGTNARMTEYQAAIGRGQLRKLNDWIATRRRNAQLITDALMPFAEQVRLPIPPEHIYHAFYKYCCFIPSGQFKDGWDRDRLLHALEQRGAPAYFGSCPEMSAESAFGDIAQSVSTPISRQMGEESMMFLVHPTIDEDGARWYADTIAAAVSDALVAL